MFVLFHAGYAMLLVRWEPVPKSAALLIVTKLIKLIYFIIIIVIAFSVVKWSVYLELQYTWLLDT